MRLFKLALRNLRRNPRRTALTLLAIVVGLALSIWVVVIQAGQHDDMRRTAISTLAGHVVVQAPGYQQDRPVELAVTGVDAVRDALAGVDAEGVVTRRIWLDGLLTSAAGSAGVQLTAVDPTAEAAVGSAEERMVAGEWLPEDDARAIVIGQGLADTLSVGVGDKVVFMGQFGQDEMQSRLFRVRGVFRTGAAEIDSGTAWAPLPAGQELLGKPDAAHQVALHLPGGADVDAAVAAARARVEPLGPADVRSWQEALPELGALLDIDARSNDVILGIFGIIVAMGVLNTVLMSVMERSREFGVLMAIGLRPSRLAALVLLEAAILGTIGMLLGLAGGLALAWPAVEHGLDFTEMMGESYSAGGVVTSAVMHGRYHWARIAGYCVGTVLFTVAAAAWPARVVTRLTPLAAMHRL